MTVRRLLDPRWQQMVRALGMIFDELGALDQPVGLGVNAVSLEAGQPPEQLAWLVDLPNLAMRKVAVMDGAEDAVGPLVEQYVIDIDAPADVAGAEQNGE